MLPVLRMGPPDDHLQGEALHSLLVTTSVSTVPTLPPITSASLAVVVTSRSGQAAPTAYGFSKPFDKRARHPGTTVFRLHMTRDVSYASAAAYHLPAILVAATASTCRCLDHRSASVCCCLDHRSASACRCIDWALSTTPAAHLLRAETGHDLGSDHLPLAVVVEQPTADTEQLTLFFGPSLAYLYSAGLDPLPGGGGGATRRG